MRTLSFTVCLTSSSTSSRGCRMLLPGLYWLRRRDSVRSHLTDLCWLPVRQRILQKVAVLVFRCVHGFAPRYLMRLITNRTCHRSLRSSSVPRLAVPKTCLVRYGWRSFSSAAPNAWNSLPNHIRSSTTLSSFLSRLRPHLRNLIWWKHPCLSCTCRLKWQDQAMQTSYMWLQDFRDLVAIHRVTIDFNHLLQLALLVLSLTHHLWQFASKSQLQTNHSTNQDQIHQILLAVCHVWFKVISMLTLLNLFFLFRRCWIQWRRPFRCFGERLQSKC